MTPRGFQEEPKPADNRQRERDELAERRQQQRRKRMSPAAREHLERLEAVDKLLAEVQRTFTAKVSLPFGRLRTPEKREVWQRRVLALADKVEDLGHKILDLI